MGILIRQTYTMNIAKNTKKHSNRIKGVERNRIILIIIINYVYSFLHGV